MSRATLEACMTDPARQLVDFVQRELLRGRGGTITTSTPLVSSGLIDSLAQVDLVVRLEEITGKRLSAGTISPEDLETVDNMLAVVRQIPDNSR